MPISDEDLVRQLESVPLVESPDFREAVMGRVRAGFSPGDRLRPVRRQKTRLYLGLAWAAAVAIVVGVALFRTPGPRPQSAAATMTTAEPELVVLQSGDRFVVQPSVQGSIEWDPAKLTKVGSKPDGSVILQRNPGASGTAEIRLRVSGREVAKTSIHLD